MYPRILHLLFWWGDTSWRRGVLRAWIWCEITLVCSIIAVVLWFRAASLESFEDPTYCGLRDPERGLHGD
jgi:hypothetical protein